MERDKGGMKICPICKKEFLVESLSEWAFTKKKSENRKIQYCSWSCYRAEEKKKEKRRCINCGKEIIGNGKLFCDYYCRVDYEQLNKENPRQTLSGKLLSNKS